MVAHRHQLEAAARDAAAPDLDDGLDIRPGEDDEHEPHRTWRGSRSGDAADYERDWCAGDYL